MSDEDLTQEVCVRALDAFRRAGDVKYPRAFLMKIVSDTIRDHWRRRRSGETVDFLEERFFRFTPDFEDEIDRDRKIDLLRRSLARLDTPKRHVIALYYEQGLSVREIAKRQGRTQSAVKMDLLRGRQKLAHLMGAAQSKT